MPSFTTISASPRSPVDTFAYIVDLTRWPSFRGFGPLPGIVSATLASGERMEAGARVRVVNTDGSVHHEVVEELVAARRYRVRMELGEPARRVLAGIEETVELAAVGHGTRITRRFSVTARAPWTAPIAWLVARVFLRRAVERHNAAVAHDLAATSPIAPITRSAGAATLSAATSTHGAPRTVGRPD